MIKNIIELPSRVLSVLPITQEQKKVIAVYMREAAEQVNEQLTGLEPHQIVLISVCAVLIVQYGMQFITWSREACTVANIKAEAFKFAAKYIPQVKSHIDGELEKLRIDSVKKYGGKRKGIALKALPNEGKDPQEVINLIEKYTASSYKTFSEGGNITGAVYNNEKSHWDFLSKAMRPALPSNPLHLAEFAYANTMEAEIIRWTLNLYNGGPDTCGIVTSGGTESIILAMLAYREKALKERGVTKPNIVMSETGHCAFDKAGFYYQIEIRKVPITKDFMADLEGMKKVIDSNTICLVASAPEYAYGNYDPIEEIAALAQSWGIGCHSDCCLGSYVNPFIEELGYKLAYKFDFRVPGVTSISCDPHKYAYGPKGCSLCLFRERSLREAQFYVNTSWNGGIYATTCVAGSRPGSVIVGTWASMLKYGRNGLKQKAKGILEAQHQIKLAFKNDPEITVCSTQASPIFSYTSKIVNPIAMCEEMLKRRQWTIAALQNPSGAHLAITDATAPNWKDFVSSIRECVKAMKEDPKLNKNHDTAVYGLTGTIPDKALLHKFVSIHQSALLDTLE